jgi:hypothetical protein
MMSYFTAGPAEFRDRQTQNTKRANGGHMPNEYSVEIHNYLSQKISDALKSIEKNDGSSPLHQGQLEELYWIREYLRKNVDLKDFPYY